MVKMLFSSGLTRWANATNDYNLFVVDGNGNIVAASTNVQNGSQDPYESINGIPSGDALVIVLHSGVARFLHLDLASQNGTLNWVTRPAHTRPCDRQCGRRVWRRRHPRRHRLTELRAADRPVSKPV